MDSQRTGLTTNGITLPHASLMLLALLAVASGLYLTNHYYQVMFPSSLEGSGTLCNFSNFWSCDTATTSRFGSLFHVPTSVFGLIFGIIVLAGSLFPSARIEKTNYYLSVINGLGCLVLLVYSIVALGHLCPVCTFYYLVSWGILFLYWKHSDRNEGLSLPYISFSLTLFLAVALGFRFNITNKIASQAKIENSFVQQFFSHKKIGDPKTESQYKIHESSSVFKNAPLRVSVFSDFECPFCEKMAVQGHDIIKRYGDKVNIQYFFYPLDSNCNSKMKRQLHPHACLAAQVSACVPKKNFANVHDVIFENQASLSVPFLNELASEYGALDCVKQPESLELIKTHIKIGDEMKIRSTPTFILNGVKIEGMLKNNELFAIMDAILERS